MTYQPSNKFEVLARRFINKRVLSGGEIQKNRKSILREERLKKEKKEKPVKVRKVTERELLRKMTVKISLERINTQEGNIVKTLLYSRVTLLVISSEFARKKKFKLKKIKRLIYMRSVDEMFNK